MNVSDLVAYTIMKILEESGGEASIKRNELAQTLGCVPSQINYVIMSRFTPERGYIVESRRGGGGFIRITKVKIDKSSMIMHTVNSIGGSISQESAKAILYNLLHLDIIEAPLAKIMVAAVSDSAFKELNIPTRDYVRAGILKQMLVNLI